VRICVVLAGGVVLRAQPAPFVPESDSQVLERRFGDVVRREARIMFLCHSCVGVTNAARDHLRHPSITFTDSTRGHTSVTFG
jgi:hypothetical protein